MTRKPLVIIGAGGHGRVVLDAALAGGMPVAGFLEAGEPPGARVNGYPVLGNDGLLSDRAFLDRHDFLVAIGSQSVRRRISLGILDAGGTLATVLHPRCCVAATARIGPGSIVSAGAIINPNADVARFCIINTASTIDHDVRLADGVQICPGVNLAGGVRCDENAFVGTGAVAIPNVRIGADAVVGAGAVVVRDVPAGYTVIGNPARPVAVTGR